MKPKRTTKIVDALNALNKTDIYSLMLFTIYKMHDDPKFSTLSELCYILDNESLIKFLSFYGGMTIKVPELKEMRLMLKALELYQYVNLEKGPFEEALKVAVDEFSEAEIKAAYQKILNVVANYEFQRS